MVCKCSSSCSRGPCARALPEDDADDCTLYCGDLAATLEPKAKIVPGCYSAVRLLRSENNNRVKTDANAYNRCPGKTVETSDAVSPFKRSVRNPAETPVPAKARPYVRPWGSQLAGSGNSAVMNDGLGSVIRTSC